MLILQSIVAPYSGLAAEIRCLRLEGCGGAWDAYYPSRNSPPGFSCASLFWRQRPPSNSTISSRTAAEQLFEKCFSDEPHLWHNTSSKIDECADSMAKGWVFSKRIGTFGDSIRLESITVLPSGVHCLERSWYPIIEAPAHDRPVFYASRTPGIG